jgi:hypothetical protein
VIGADRNHDSLVPQHRLGDARRYHADSKLAALISLNDGDVGVADLALDAASELPSST